MVAGWSVGRADPPDRPELTAPAIIAAGQGDWLWVIRLAQGGRDSRGTQGATAVIPRGPNRTWGPVQEKHLPRLAAAAARGDTLDVFLPDGRHFLYRAKADGTLLEPLPRGLRIVAAASDGNRLFVLASGPADIQLPSQSEPTTGPAGSTQAAPESRPVSPDHCCHLLVQEFGPWKPMAGPPPAIAEAQRVSFVIHQLRPTLVALVGNSPVLVELTDQPAGVSPQWRLTAIRTPDSLPGLLDVAAVSVNQQLYVVCWPDLPDALPSIGRIEQDELVEVAELPSPGGPSGRVGLLRSRWSQWDFAPAGAGTPALALVAAGPGRAGLQVRHFDLQSRRFEDDWTEVASVGGPGNLLVRATQHPAFTVVMVIILGLLFLTRRPVRPIRLPVHVEPARVLPRAAAFLIDLLPCSTVASVLVYGPDREAHAQAARMLLTLEPADARLTAAVLLAVGIFLLYQTLAEALLATTGGKRLFRLAVYSVRGTRPTMVQVVVRNLVKGVELAVLPLAAILMLLHPAHQRLGDLVAGTIVVGPRRRGSPPAGPPTDDLKLPKDNTSGKTPGGDEQAD